ncbi:MAG: Rieske (2Fe-2S) protein, partial [Planctomycetes bacterium]|nr:Rieske (2Fe-2S) protein [Planctomycetota bacterium]
MPEEQAAGLSTEEAVETEIQWYKVADPDEVAESSVTAVEAGPRTIALTRLDGQYGAIDGRCPHQG